MHALLKLELLTIDIIILLESEKNIYAESCEGFGTSLHWADIIY